MSKQLNNYHVQTLGENLVLRLLGERGYVATLVRGNAPETDILARVPNGKSFSVEVKAMNKETTWRFKKPAQNTDFWFFVIVGSNEPIVSIMTGQEVFDEWTNYYRKSCETQPYKKERYPENSGGWGLDKKTVQRYSGKDKWGKLPSTI